MTVPIPPQSGPTTSQERLDAEDHGVAPDIFAPQQDLSGITAQAVSAGEAWCAGAADWADSPQGDGAGGFALGGDHPAGAAHEHWADDMSFPHQGP
jgi:hypothetical protein